MLIAFPIWKVRFWTTVVVYREPGLSSVIRTRRVLAVAARPSLSEPNVGGSRDALSLKPIQPTLQVASRTLRPAILMVATQHTIVPFDPIPRDFVAGSQVIEESLKPLFLSIVGGDPLKVAHKAHTDVAFISSRRASVGSLPLQFTPLPYSTRCVDDKVITDVCPSVTDLVR